MDDGVRSGEEGESHIDQGRFAEHGGEAGEGWRGRQEGREILSLRKQLSAVPLCTPDALALVPTLEGMYRCREAWCTKTRRARVNSSQFCWIGLAVQTSQERMLVG